MANSRILPCCPQRKQNERRIPHILEKKYSSITRFGVRILLLLIAELLPLHVDTFMTICKYDGFGHYTVNRDRYTLSSLLSIVLSCTSHFMLYCLSPLMTSWRVASMNINDKARTDRPERLQDDTAICRALIHTVKYSQNFDKNVRFTGEAPLYHIRFICPICQILSWMTTKINVWTETFRFHCEYFLNGNS